MFTSKEKTEWDHFPVGTENSVPGLLHFLYCFVCLFVLVFLPSFFIIFLFLFLALSYKMKPCRLRKFTINSVLFGDFFPFTLKMTLVSRTLFKSTKQGGK